MNAKHITLSHLLGAPLNLGGALTHGGLTVFPLLGRDCAAEFISLDQALPQGLRIEEIPGGEVNNLLVINPTKFFVLLLDGQEVLGARQNRIFDGSFLVAPGTESVVSVCCIERGRWEASREREAFRSASHFADPRVRAAQRETRSIRHDGTLRSDQRSVWKSIDGVMESTRTFSRTASLSEVQASFAEVEEDLSARIAPVEGQLGVLVYLGGELLGVELLGRADVYRDVHEKLIRGFSLVAAERDGEGRGVTLARARTDLERLLAQPVTLEPIPAGSHRVASEADGELSGHGLSQRGALVHWSMVAA
jgi:hypothetical protein